jgi:glycerol-3-phosphate acyltransferase PlsX
MPVTVAIDAMGGDFGPPVTVPAALAFIDAFDDARVILVGLEPELTRALAGARSEQRARIEVRHASEKVALGEPPADALRKI